MNPLETNEQGEHLCHWCKRPVAYAALGIRVIVQDGRAVRIGTCYDHRYTEAGDQAQ